MLGKQQSIGKIQEYFKLKNNSNKLYISFSAEKFANINNEFIRFNEIEEVILDLTDCRTVKRESQFSFSKKIALDNIMLQLEKLIQITVNLKDHINSYENFLELLDCHFWENHWLKTTLVIEENKYGYIYELDDELSESLKKTLNKGLSRLKNLNNIEIKGYYNSFNDECVEILTSNNPKDLCHLQHFKLDASQISGKVLLELLVLLGVIKNPSFGFKLQS